MSLLLETICIQDQKICHWPSHAKRMERSLAALGLPLHFDLTELEHTVEQKFQVWPGGEGKRRIKCRLLYSSQLESITFIPYDLPQIRTLEIVESALDYSCKFADRRALEVLRSHSQADDVLIVKSGFVTDSTFCNVAFRSGGDWLTPRNPLLYGTRRETLLQESLIKEADLPCDSLARFTEVMLFNAMIGPFEIVLPWPECLSGRTRCL
ncbi:MAG: aminotransferase class IV [Spirochaetales bacterium]|nr:aminotransferase class IV [Spirochaetales bacterium]